MTEDPTSLSRGQTNRAMRSFIAASGLWGVWGQAVGIGTAAFTGFALHLGADESFIALFTSKSIRARTYADLSAFSTHT